MSPRLRCLACSSPAVERGFAIDPAVVIKEYVREHITSFRLGPVRIDWLKPVLPLYSRVILSASPLDWSEGHPLRVATAEGLILTKMVSFRPQDQMDIETLLTANRDTIDVQLIRDEWSPFAETEAERTAWLEATIARRVVRRMSRRFLRPFPRRWVVERTFGWLGRFRRLARDYERLTITLEGWHWLAAVCSYS